MKKNKENNVYLFIYLGTANEKKTRNIIAFITFTFKYITYVLSLEIRIHQIISFSEWF